jgi:diguanylate cyclase (GGDEF)-like protein
MRVLLVDDAVVIRAVVNQLLAKRGHEVVALGDGESAWEVCQREAFPLVILDWVLPGMDGLELCRRIRGLPWGEAAVILIITSREKPKDLISVLGAGANDYLPKPFTPAALEVRLTVAENQVASILERRRAEEALEYQALHDALTGLPNRTLLRDRLQQALFTARRQNDWLALFVMDLDAFKEINDTFGHLAGDDLLQQVAQKLRTTLRESDTLARLGGDEFAAILPGTDQLGAVAAARKLLSTLEGPFDVQGQRLSAGISIGIALSPPHGEDYDTLLRRADSAMYVAKQARSGYAVFSFEQDQQTPGRLALMSELRQAIDDHQLIVHYQPRVDIGSRRLTGVEALVRWRHPQHGLIPPVRFVPLAEQTGFIRPLTEWVLSAALAQGQAWRQAQVAAPLLVNISARDVYDSSLAEFLRDLMRKLQVTPGMLVLEITERAIMASPARAMDSTARLRAIGVEVSIDDFGTGYSSLSYLQRLPISSLKVDRAFVSRMSRDPNDFAIVRSTIDLAHNLGLAVIAEGVEDEETWIMLESLRCDEAQGNYVCPPLAASDLSRWLKETRPDSVHV